jgi:hypothetical protein
MHSPKKNMPLSDVVHGPSGMMPPELLHTSGSGLIKYMFQSMQLYIGESILRDEIDRMHVNLKKERVTFFCYFALVATTMGSEKLRRALKYDSNDTWSKWIKFVVIFINGAMVPRFQPKGGGRLHKTFNWKGFVFTQRVISKRWEWILHTKNACNDKVSVLY